MGQKGMLAIVKCLAMALTLFALSHKDLYMLPGDVPSGKRLPAGAE